MNQKTRLSSPLQKKRNRRTRTILITISLALFLLITLTIAMYGVHLWRALSGHPLILITNPTHQGDVALNEGIIIQATVRAKEGIQRAELWVNDELISARTTEPGQSASPLILTAGWEPTQSGQYTIVVRATTRRGVQGSGSITVNAVEVAAQEPQYMAHIADENDTIESIAEEYGLTEEEIHQNNPALEDEGLLPGDAVDIPSGSSGAPAPGEESPPPEADESPSPPPVDGAEEPPPSPEEPPPDPFGEPPGVFGGFIEDIFFFFDIPEDPGPQVYLRLEAHALQSSTAFESLHCYIGIADSVPQWYPNTDGDPTTDESFAPLDDNHWDVSAHLSGENGLIIPWHAHLPLPVNVNCVGTTEGGTEAVEVGLAEINAEPITWDGHPRTIDSRHGEASFSLDYSISQLDIVPLELDPDMTPPTNARVGFFSVWWDYQPEDDEVPADVFRVYLNGTLVWQEPADQRWTGIPYEWFSPPCGETHTITITAYRYADDAESYPSNPVILHGDEPPCEHTVVVTFETLHTGNYIGEYDASREDMVGAVYGQFYANEHAVDFDGRGERELFFENDTYYGIGSLTSTFSSSSPRMIIDVPPGEDLILGYAVFDQDSGSDPQICHAEFQIDNERLAESHDDWMGDWVDDNCAVHYLVRPALGSPAAGSWGGLPLPHLQIDDLTIDSDNGQLQIHLRNAGDATWPGEDLEIMVKRQDSSALGFFVVPELVLRPGEARLLQWPELAPERPMDVCVLLDPGNRVLEEGEGYGWERHRYCRPLPDLTITDVLYQTSHGRLLVTLRNTGDGDLENRNLSLRIEFPGGAYFAAPAEWWSDVSIDRYQYLTMEWPGIGAAQREYMMDGYTVVIDPDDAIAETDNTNNTYEIRESRQVALRWLYINTHYYPFVYGDSNEDQTFYMDITAESPVSSRMLRMWDYGPYEVERGFAPSLAPHYQTEFRLAGDENLVVFGSADIEYRRDIYFLGTTETAYTPDDDWGARKTIAPGEECRVEIYERSDDVAHWRYITAPEAWSSCPSWNIAYIMCLIEE